MTSMMSSVLKKLDAGCMKPSQRCILQLMGVIFHAIAMNGHKTVHLNPLKIIQLNL